MDYEELVRDFKKEKCYEFIERKNIEKTFFNENFEFDYLQQIATRVNRICSYGLLLFTVVHVGSGWVGVDMGSCRVGTM